MNKIEFEKSFLIAKIKDIPLFKYLSEQDKDAILSIFDIFQYDENQLIIKEGATDSFFCIMLKGEADVTVSGGQNHRETITVGHIKEKSLFGEAAMFSDAKRTASIVARGTVQVIKIDRKKFIAFVRTHTQAGVNILLMMIHTLLQKLKVANQDIAWERKAMVDPKDFEDFLKNCLD